MEVPKHISQMTYTELEDWVVNTPEHNPTPLEIYLVSEWPSPQIISDFEEQIEDLTEALEATQDDFRSADSALEASEIALADMEKDRDEWEDQVNEINAVFPEDVIEFFREACMWQINNAKWKKKLTEQSSQTIRAENERNDAQKEIMDLKLQIKMYDAAGLEK